MLAPGARVHWRGDIGGVQRLKPGVEAGVMGLTCLDVPLVEGRSASLGPRGCDVGVVS